jgi:hypothetical protein
MQSDAIRGAQSPKAKARQPLTEALEGRVLLAATPNVSVADKAQPLDKVATGLAGVFQEFKAHKAKGAKAGKFMTRDPLLRVNNERVSVQVLAKPGQEKVLERDLKRLGVTRVRRFGAEVSGQVPLGAIERLAGLKSIRFHARHHRPSRQVDTRRPRADHVRC